MSGYAEAGGVVPAIVQILADGRPASFNKVARAINGR
jgi:hypothetical protein